MKYQCDELYSFGVPDFTTDPTMLKNPTKYIKQFSFNPQQQQLQDLQMQGNDIVMQKNTNQSEKNFQNQEVQSMRVISDLKNQEADNLVSEHQDFQTDIDNILLVPSLPFKKIKCNQFQIQIDNLETCLKFQSSQNNIEFCRQLSNCQSLQYSEQKLSNNTQQMLSQLSDTSNINVSQVSVQLLKVNDIETDINFTTNEQINKNFLKESQKCTSVTKYPLLNISTISMNNQIMTELSDSLINQINSGEREIIINKIIDNKINREILLNQEPHMQFNDEGVDEFDESIPIHKTVWFNSNKSFKQ